MDKETNISEQNEQVIQDYFTNRLGWSATKLDKSNKSQSPDFRICHPDGCFLCEVKTISSVHASYPDKPIDYLLEERQKQRLDIEQWREKNPTTRLVMPKSQYDYLFSDEKEFITKYGQRRRNTQAEFSSFADTMQKDFANSIVSDLPYTLRLDSDDLYAPTKDESRKFFKWLEKEISAIHSGNPSWNWHVEPYLGLASYRTFYEIHTPKYDGDTKSQYLLTLSRILHQTKFQVELVSYGGLNLGPITQNIEKAVTQLETKATTEDDPNLPRIIVLAFESGIGFEWDTLFQHLWYELEQHKNVNAIAVLQWKPDTEAPSQDEGLAAWLAYLFSAPIVPFFVVFHNAELQNDIKPLHNFVFDDKWSTQLYSPQKAT